MSVNPCKLQKLYALSEIERSHSIIHHLHVKQLVDSFGPKFSNHIQQFEEPEDLRDTNRDPKRPKPPASVVSWILFLFCFVRIIIKVE